MPVKPLRSMRLRATLVALSLTVAAAPATQPTLVRLANGDFLGLLTVNRYIEKPGGHLDVMLSTGQTLTLTGEEDVAAVRRGLGRLNLAGRV